MPWNQIKLPSLPTAAGCDEAFVLQTLLLHNGLAIDILQQLLPMPPNQVLETIYRLEEAELVNQEQTVWLVTPKGYPAVRQFLSTNNYLVDQF
jgi:predicted transcriptional regulator